ncbi:fimbria/pilus outer membrane usher protein [Acinetobacter puyangensis]|uniref:fimbria/pilus outer membrane usher protein n=1 Tax=Acinetobacter puyangensis TaxID=1096779 RepID=UPI003A4E12CD
MEKKTILRPYCMAILLSGILLETAQAQSTERIENAPKTAEKIGILSTHKTNENLIDYPVQPAQEVNSTEQVYIFDSNLFKGTGLSAGMIERFNHADQIEADSYKVDIYINKRFVERQTIRFAENKNAPQGVDACLTPDILEHAGILGDVSFREQLTNQSLPQNDCLTLSQVAKSSSSQLDFSILRLDLSVPQSLMKNLPRGYVNPADLDAGTSIGFINYLGNYYYTENRINNGSNYESAFMSLNGGINFGKWQYRQQSSLTMDNNHETKWNNIRSYVQRPIDQLKSQLTLGQDYTSGRFFSGLPYIGLNLATDQRMRPDSLRGYAPVIRGIAQTNAKVSVQQNGQEIYQITVAPGSFEINDLYPTNYNGNLTVVVTEADGSQHSTTVPYAAVPTSLREGLSNYSLSLGRTDLNATENTIFSDLDYEYGVNNNITINSGLRISDDYQAAAFGGVYGNVLGALGANITYSRAKLPTPNGWDNVDGWMANLTYSKTFTPTNTTIALAGYRYSTKGYRDLNDVLGIRYAWNNGTRWSSDSYLQHSRFQVSISQPLGNYGSLYVSGSTQNYRDGRKRDTLYQVGYNKNFGILNLNLNYTRQKVHSINGGAITEERFDNYGGLSISLPLGRNRTLTTPRLNANYNRSNDRDNYQLDVTGAFDENYSFGYNVGMSGTGDSDQQNYNAGLYKRFSNIQLGANTSYSNQYWQGSLNASGALAIHAGGVTFGSYLGDTFALVEAKGAEGATVINAPYSKVDRFGYVLVPSITPYRYNNLVLDPQGTSSNVEIEGGEQRIAPYAGAAVKVKFKTRMGYSVLIQSELEDDSTVPMGAEVRNADGAVIGMVGQSGQVYVRVEQQKGTLLLNWGDETAQSCLLPYQIDNQQLTQPLIKLSAQCKMEH